MNVRRTFAMITALTTLALALLLAACGPFAAPQPTVSPPQGNVLATSPTVHCAPLKAGFRNEFLSVEEFLTYKGYRFEAMDGYQVKASYPEGYSITFEVGWTDLVAITEVTEICFARSANKQIAVFYRPECESLTGQEVIDARQEGLCPDEGGSP